MIPCCVYDYVHEILYSILTWNLVQLISGAFEHSVLRVWEIYALENVVFYIAYSLWAVQTIHYLYTQHGMFKHT